MSDPVIARGIETFKRVPKEFTYMQMELDYKHCWNALITIARLVTATYSTHEATAQYELTGESMFKTPKRDLHASSIVSLPELTKAIYLQLGKVVEAVMMTVVSSAQDDNGEILKPALNQSSTEGKFMGHDWQSFLGKKGEYLNLTANLASWMETANGHAMLKAHYTPDANAAITTIPVQRGLIGKNVTYCETNEKTRSVVHWKYVSTAGLTPPHPGSNEGRTKPSTAAAPKENHFN
jgi:hypothetical protein